MGMRRSARRHETIAAAKQGVRSEEWWEHKPGARVITIDGPGRVTAVNDGPHPGNESYEIELDGGLGGGTYGAGQITAASPVQASVTHTADQDYPVLQEVLCSHPDPASLTYTASFDPGLAPEDVSDHLVRDAVLHSQASLFAANTGAGSSDGPDLVGGELGTTSSHKASEVGADTSASLLSIAHVVADRPQHQVCREVHTGINIAGVPHVHLAGFTDEMPVGPPVSLHHAWMEGSGVGAIPEVAVAQAGRGPRPEPAVCVACAFNLAPEAVLDRLPGATASDLVHAANHVCSLASHWYPELGTLLHDRPDPAKLTYTASLEAQAVMSYEDGGTTEHTPRDVGDSPKGDNLADHLARDHNWPGYMLSDDDAENEEYHTEEHHEQPVSLGHYHGNDHGHVEPDDHWCQAHEEYHDDPKEADDHLHNSARTDWSQYTRDIPDEIHRGMNVELPQDVHDFVHDEDRSTHERAEKLLHHLKGGMGIGMHWSTEKDSAKSFAEPTYDKDGSTRIIMTAETPHPDDFETDPDKLDGAFHFTHEESEIPVKRGTPLKLTSLQWNDQPEIDAKARAKYSPPEASKYTHEWLHPYTHHDFEEPHTLPTQEPLFHVTSALGGDIDGEAQEVGHGVTGFEPAALHSMPNDEHDFSLASRRTAAEHYTDYDDPNKVYLRFGYWPKDERSRNNVTGHREEGVSVYDLDKHGEPMDPDAGLDRWHEHDHTCESDCDLDQWNEDYGNDTGQEMRDRTAHAEQARRRGYSDDHPDTGHLVRGEMIGVGHDGEPLLRKVKRVGDWIDHRHLFVPGAQPHHLAREPHDEDYEEPEEQPTHHTASRDDEHENLGPVPGDVDRLRQHMISDHGFTEDQIAGLPFNGQDDPLESQHEMEHDLSTTYPGGGSMGGGDNEGHEHVHREHEPEQRSGYAPFEAPKDYHPAWGGSYDYSHWDDPDRHYVPAKADPRDLPLSHFSSLPSVLATEKNFWNDRLPEIRREHAKSSEPERIIRRMRRVGDPDKEGYAYIGDGGAWCPECKKGRERLGEDTSDMWPISWGDLGRSADPSHGERCNDCDDELIPPRPHPPCGDSDCPSSLADVLHGTSDERSPMDEHVLDNWRGREHEYDKNTPPHLEEYGKNWHGEDHFQSTLAEKHEQARDIKRGQQAQQDVSHQINQMFSGPEFAQHKTFMEKNPGSATHLSSLPSVLAHDWVGHNDDDEEAARRHLTEHHHVQPDYVYAPHTQHDRLHEELDETEDYDPDLHGEYHEHHDVSQPWNPMPWEGKDRAGGGTYDDADRRALAPINTDVFSPVTHSLSMLVTAAMDPEFRFHITAAWSDVRAKAKRIRSQGGVQITHASDAMIVGNVKGDHNIYETGLQRYPGKRQSVATYSCGCKWGAYHWGAPDDMSRFAGRMCSHALALQYEAASRGMFGRDVEVDDLKPKWVPSKVVVKYDIDNGQSIRAESSRRIPEHSPLLVALAMMEDDDPAVQVITAAVNDLFGDTSGYSEPSLLQPQGPTSPWNVDDNPGASGPLTASEPNNWGRINGPSMFPRIAHLLDKEAFWQALVPVVRAVAPKVLKTVAPAMISHEVNKHQPQPAQETTVPTGTEYGPQATLHEEPEGALPSTDGEEHEASLGDVNLTGGGGIGSTMRPEDKYTASLGDVDIVEGTDIASADGDELSPENPSIQTMGGVHDIVAEFQRSASAQSLMASGGRKSNDNMDLAAAAEAYLVKTAKTTEFTRAEQEELINESPGTQASNTDRLDLEGTHYAELERMAADDEGDDALWMMV